jgi:hypothetical protein
MACLLLYGCIREPRWGWWPFYATAFHKNDPDAAFPAAVGDLAENLAVVSAFLVDQGLTAAQAQSIAIEDAAVVAGRVEKGRSAALNFLLLEAHTGNRTQSESDYSP